MRPKYSELPLLPDTDLRHAWDYFGDGDALGTLNLLTEQRRRAAATLARQGRTVNLSLPLTEPAAAPFGRLALQHEVFRTSSFSWDDRITRLDMQASSQWDGLLHVQHRTYGFYGGRQSGPEPFDKLGIQRWVEHGIVGRGVLLDLETYYREAGEEFDPLQPTAVPPEDLLRVAEAQGVELREGDILCLRFGWLAAHARADQSSADGTGSAESADMATSTDAASSSAGTAEAHGAGLHAGVETARFLWDLGVAAVACDNPAVEVQPGSRDVGYLHHRLLTMLGMPLGELFALDELADECRASGNWDFLFMSAPLNVPGAIGSPANALALL
ncbi:putative cyclase [Jatrophihabitans sp. GAS493]|uniref:cyclase family protein n=1 Tax=Jatrophihabitans sp. GAS493 TaxID=1907575 RepID=UPI000BB9B300|nr:cyclase family protein [Jatrophihabitans sp. GAS493]SOD74673.1 putative cyclase [Jatrophihabitans sp. GAS493]